MKTLNAEKNQSISQSKNDDENENIDENEMISVTLNDYGSVCGSCTIYIELFVIAFLIITGITSAFIYFHMYLKKSNTDLLT